MKDITIISMMTLHLSLSKTNFIDFEKKCLSENDCPIPQHFRISISRSKYILRGNVAI